MQQERHNAKEKGFPTDQSLEASTVTPPTKGNATMTSLASNEQFAQPQVTVINGVAKTTSLQVAEFFGKRHDNVIRAIENLKADMSVFEHALNFEEMHQSVATHNGGSKMTRFFEMTKNGFTLLVMGFTGKQAMQFKIAYINRFDEMEAILKGEATPKLTRATITPEQQAILHSIVDRRVNGFDSLRAGLWKRHNKHFGIAKYSQLLASRFDDAVAYLESAELRYPKPKEKINDGCHFFAVKDGVVIYQLPISQQAINAELVNNKPLMLEHIKQVIGEFVGQQTLEHKPVENENNLVIISRDTTNKVMDYFAALRHEINRLNGKLPIAPNFDKETIVRAVVTDMMDSSRMLVSFDYLTGKPNISFVPNDCFVATRDNLAQVIAGGDGIPKKYLPDIINAAVNRLSSN